MLCTEVLVPRAGQPPGWPATQQLRLPLSRELQHSPSTRLSKYISWAQSHSSLLLGRDRAEDKLCRAADRQRHTAPPAACSLRTPWLSAPAVRMLWLSGSHLWGHNQAL